MSPRASILSVVSLRILILSAILPVLGPGCARNVPYAPGLISTRAASVAGAEMAARAGAASFFPLQIGSRWTAQAQQRITVRAADGSIIDDETIHANIAREMIGTETIANRSYVIERTTVDALSPFGPYFANETWVRYRQDAAGLYEADVAPNIPPVLNSDDPANSDAKGPSAIQSAPSVLDRLQADHRDAFRQTWNRLQRRVLAIRSLHDPASLAAAGPRGGLMPGELTRLAYPLRPGAEWAVRDDPFFGSVVESNQSIQVPAGRFPGTRIRLVSVFDGPNDWIRLWMSRAGQLALRFHIEAEAVDPNGNPLGTLILDYNEGLSSVSLAGL
jgi:hypothetical protein